MVKTAPVGEAFLIDQDGTLEERKVWVGLLYSPDGWQRTQQYSRDFLRRELLYVGSTGNTLEISYREFRAGYAAPAFFQSLKYDLNVSHVIRFQNFTIEVLQSDNQKIAYKILGDRG
jgi:hypothetical protein